MTRPKPRPRFRLVATCKAPKCRAQVTSRCKSGYCRKHRHKTKPRQPWNYDRWQEWLGRPGNRAKYRASIARWAKNNPEKRKKGDAAYQKQKRDRDILAACAEARKHPKPLNPNAEAAVKRAVLRAEQERYGIERVAYA